MSGHTPPLAASSDAPDTPSDPVLTALLRIEGRLGHLHERLDRVEALVHEGEGLAAMIGDTVDQHLQRAAARGVDVEERALASLRIAEKLTEPELLRRLELLLSRTDQLEASLMALGEIPNLAATGADTLDTALARIQSHGIDIDERLDSALIAMERLTSPSALVALKAMFDTSSERDSACLHSDAALSPVLSLLVDTADALAETQRAAIPEPGLFSVLGAMREPEVRKAVGFALQLARGLGRRLEQRRLADTTNS